MRYLAIRTEQLTKTYGHCRGIEDITLEVEPGEIFGILGLDGAGKTTYIRLLMGEIQPTRGEVLIFCLEQTRQRKEILPRVGYIPENRPHHIFGTVKTYLHPVAVVQGSSIWQEACSMAEQIGLELNTPLNYLSREHSTILSFIKAWIRKPDLMILDETTQNLPAIFQDTIYRHIQQLRRQGGAILLSSSSAAEMERICDRVAVFHKGRLVTVERGVHLRAKSLRRVEMRFAVPVQPEIFSCLPNLEDVQLEDNRLSCILRGDPDPLIKLVSQYRVVDLTSQQLSLDEVFRRNYGIRAA